MDRTRGWQVRYAELPKATSIDGVVLSQPQVLGHIFGHFYVLSWGLCHAHLAQVGFSCFQYLMKLSNVPNLHVFCTKCSAPPNLPPNAGLHDINIVLGAISEVTNLWLHFMIAGRGPFPGFLEQAWVGMFNEVIRIADGKPLSELELQMVVSTGSL